MKRKFYEGQVVYLVSSKIFLRKATVLNYRNGLVTIRFDQNLSENGIPSGTRVRENRLYESKFEAEKEIAKNKEYHRTHPVGNGELD